MTQELPDSAIEFSKSMMEIVAIHDEIMEQLQQNPGDPVLQRKALVLVVGLHDQTSINMCALIGWLDMPPDAAIAIARAEYLSVDPDDDEEEGLPYAHD